MDRTKIKDQFGQFGRRREYGADDDRTTSRQMKNQGGCAPRCGTICIRCGVCSDNGGLQDGCESAE